MKCGPADTLTVSNYLVTDRIQYGFCNNLRTWRVPINLLDQDINESPVGTLRLLLFALTLTVLGYLFPLTEETKFKLSFGIL